MKDDFHLLDLVSQAAAVQRILRGKSTTQKLAWLSAHGKVVQVEKKMREWPDTYSFESSTGATCAFILQEDVFRFVGDHHLFTVLDDTNAKN